MGHEVAYCARCANRVSGAVTGEMRLVSHDSRFYCEPCYRVASSPHLPVVKAAVRPSSDAAQASKQTRRRPALDPLRGNIAAAL